MQDVASGNESISIPLVGLKPQDQTRESLERLRGDLELYITLPIWRDGTSMLGSQNAQDHERDLGCTCTGDDCCGSTSNECECVSTFGNFYDWTKSKTSLHLEAIPTDFPLRECSRHCACNENNCRLRISQLGVKVALSVRPTAHAGLGLFAEEGLNEGTFVCVYSGEVINVAEAQRRWDEQRTDNYILMVRERWRKEAGEILTIIDARKFGNVGRFANHACPPVHNLILLPIRPVGSFHPLIAMVTRRYVAKGEELTWDYGDSIGMGDCDVSDIKQGESYRTKCFCLSEACRGWLPTSRT